MEIRLKLKIKDVEIELSKDDAKELRDMLNGLVGEKVVEQIVTSYPWLPYRWTSDYTRPYRWTTDYTMTYTPYDTWTSSSGNVHAYLAQN